MPYSIVHLELANNKNKELKLNENDLLDFFVGNLIVDSSYGLKKYGIDNIERENTHYHPLEHYFDADFPNNFYEIELKNDKNNYLKLGYYYHLLVDKVWRDNELAKTKEENTHFRYIYQISRKIHAFYDLENFINNDNGQEIIDKLYKYKIDINKYPSIYKDIDINILKKILLDILDYMTRKKHFSKGEDLLEPYKIIDDKIEIKESIKKEIDEHFPYKDYLNFKKLAKNIKI